jgi:hypothetical protein
MRSETMSEDLAGEELYLENAEMLDSEYDDDDEDIELAEYDDDDEIAEYDDDESAEYDDDDETEDAEFLGAIAPIIGGLAPTLIKGIGGLFKGKKRRTRHYSPYRRFIPRGGVKGVRIRTPRGIAHLQLPKSVVPMATYQRDISRLQARDNSLTKRINKTQSDLTRTHKVATQSLALANNANLRLTRLGRKTRRDLAKLKQDTKSSNTMNLMISMMQMQNFSSQLRNHGHNAGEVTGISGNNNAMMMLPLMMMDGAGDDSSMMMIMMMMMMQQQGSNN